jgi:hypothetical protein
VRANTKCPSNGSLLVPLHRHKGGFLPPEDPTTIPGVFRLATKPPGGHFGIGHRLTSVDYHAGRSNRHPRGLDGQPLSPQRTGGSITVVLSPFAPRKQRCFVEWKVKTLLSRERKATLVCERRQAIDIFSPDAMAFAREFPARPRPPTPRFCASAISRGGPRRPRRWKVRRPGWYNAGSWRGRGRVPVFPPGPRTLTHHTR